MIVQILVLYLPRVKVTHESGVSDGRKDRLGERLAGVGAMAVGIESVP